jgi:H+/Cl- antiporter ClcA
MRNLSKTPIKILLLGGIVGIAAGVVVSLYRYILSLAEDVSLKGYGFISEHPIWIPVAIAAVVLLALIAGLVVKIHPFASGSGIPQVELMIKEGKVDDWKKTILGKFAGGVSAVLAGLSLGREGPSIQIGAAVADGMTKPMKLDQEQKNVLLAAGASAGLAAAFSAPLAATMFAFEELFKRLTPAMMIATTIACVAADYIAQRMFGGDIFSFPITRSFPLPDYWILFLIGGIIGILGAFYNFALLWVQKWYGKLFSKWKAAKPIPMFLLAMLLGLFYPIIIGGGHSMVDDLAMTTPILLLLVMVAAKFLFAISSFASGAPGGIFFPLLIIGGGIGGIMGHITVMTGLVDQDLYYNIVMLAMAGYFAAIVRAPITGLLLLTEMTGDFTNFLPLTLVCVMAYVTAESLGSKPIYDSLLERMSRDEQKHVREQQNEDYN